MNIDLMEFIIAAPTLLLTMMISLVHDITFEAKLAILLAPAARPYLWINCLRTETPKALTLPAQDNMP